MYLIIIAIVLTLLFSQSKQFDRGKTCIWVCFCLFSISACKSVFAYGDLIGYRNRYLTLGGMSITRLWEQYVAGDMKDFGFYAIAKLFSKLGLSTEIWMAAIALFFAVCVCLCFYRASEDIFISLMGLLALYFRFTLSGLRQTLALGLVLLAYITIVDKKLPAYILLMTAAFLCHSSSLIFLPAYWIVRIKVNFKQIVIVIAALGICVFAPGYIRVLVQNFAWNESMEAYSDTTVGLTWSGYFIQLAMLVFCLFFKNTMVASEKEEKAVENLNVYINLMVVGLCIQGGSSIIAEAFRASYYYSMGVLFAVPNIVAYQSRTNRKILFACVSLAFFAYILYAGGYADLKYFWQV